MRYYQFRRESGCGLAAVDDSTAYDISSSNADLQTLGDLLTAAAIADRTPDEIASRWIESADSLAMETLVDQATVPLDVDEVWAAGVTYEISEQARETESGMPEMYLDVYDAERPEIFFKATASRTVGPGEAIGVRGDSTWDVPEPELGVVLHRGEVVGYTVGNDVSSRSIEGENPLYLPQAKVYSRCCALGPCVATDVRNPHDLEMSMTILREGETVYAGETATSEMVRTCEELVSCLARHNDLPEYAVLLTGTSLVPEEGFTLEAGDTVEIEIEGIGTLTNPVGTV